MHKSRLTKRIYRNSYRASEYLRRHRTAVISGAFVFWTGVLIVYGYFDEFGETETWSLVFGFFWLTVPMSLATYFMPRILLHAVALSNGYEPEEDREGPRRSDSG